MFHWLKLYGKAKRHAMAQITTRVDAVFAAAQAASPAVFSQSSTHQDARSTKLEHLAAHLAVATLTTTPHQTRAMLELFLDRLDIGVREAGVGEMKVGKEIRGYAAALNGRLQRYRPLLEARDWPALTAALSEHGVEAAVAKNLQKSLAEPTQLR